MPGRAAETRQYGTGVAILAGWRFCPRCRAELTHLESRVECPACGFVRYANPVPAVAALIVDDAGRLLLGRRAFEPDVGLWDTIGGFLDENEDAVAALHREVLEETGLDVEVGAFVGAFAPWPVLAASSESITPAGLTSFVNGFQSTAGLLTTTSGMVCVTMRSITC